MRPDVAAAYDRMSAAARRAGLDLVVVSGFRSDAEQAELFARHPDPRWVAPPGPLAAPLRDRARSRARRRRTAGCSRTPGSFGFLRRYPWEPWHFGFVGGPPPCSEAGNLLGPTGGSGRRRAWDGAPACPRFVPAAVPGSAAALGVALERLARPARRSADGRVGLQPEGGVPGRRSRHRPVHAGDRALLRPARPVRPGRLHRRPGPPDVGSAAPLPLRPAGARRLQRGLRRRRRLHLRPPYPETRAYVARILALADGAGVLLSPPLEVRLVS